MSSTSETQVGSLDAVKMLVSVLLLCGAVAGFYYFVDQASTLVRVLGLLAGVGASAAVFFQTGVGRNAWGFLGGARTEVRKVVWPTRAETLQTTLMVIVMVILVAIFLWLLDMMLLWAVQGITGQGG